MTRVHEGGVKGWGGRTAQVCVNGQGGTTRRGDGVSWDGHQANRHVSVNRSGEVLT